MSAHWSSVDYLFKGSRHWSSAKRVMPYCCSAKHKGLLCTEMQIVGVVWASCELCSGDSTVNCSGLIKGSLSGKGVTTSCSLVAREAEKEGRKSLDCIREWLKWKPGQTCLSP